MYLCDPIHLLLGDLTWQKLEDQHSHPSIAALIQISAIFTVFVFMVDWLGFMATLMSDFLSPDNSAFYLSVLTGLILDFVAFGWVMFVIATSCHWDCKNGLYQYFQGLRTCSANSSDGIKKLMTTIMIAPALCITNHLHYIILAAISDPFHAGSIGIAYFISLLLFYFIFRQFYARCTLQISSKQTNRSPSFRGRGPEGPQTAFPDLTTRAKIIPLKKSIKVPFNTQVVSFGLLTIGPLMMIYLAFVFVLFLSLPLTKTLEDSPSRIYTIYQGTGILIVALLTYNIVLRPSGFSITKAIERVARHLRVPYDIPNWRNLGDEEKIAYVVSRMYYSVQDQKNNYPMEDSLSDSIKVETVETTI